MARLEAETGVKLLERAGRGIRLTEAGQLLAERAAEILGRIDAAEAELTAYAGLRNDRVRLAAFGSALSTLAATATVSLRAKQPSTDLHLTQAEPEQALRMLRAGEVDVALVFRYPAQDPEPDCDDLCYEVLLDEPVYLISPSGKAGRQPGMADPAGRAGSAPRTAMEPALLAEREGQHWVAGCERCTEFLTFLCATAGFVPDIAVRADDYVAVQALVATGLGLGILPELALRAVRHPGIEATELSGVRRHVAAVTYRAPPDPQASGRLVAALRRAARAG